MDAFDRYAPFIQDFIYDHDWQSLRAVQVAAADAIFNTDENVLLTASTASGKTEAAFFPHPDRALGRPAGLGGLRLHWTAQGADKRPVPAS
jgi:Lhr-like helicase